MAAAVPLEQLPGFRRRFRITPGNGKVQTEVEDDIHCMSVILRHDGAVVTDVEPDMRRVPWTTCPGAVEQLKQTFTGVALKDFAIKGEKKINCTHLHDLATLAAEHAFDRTPTIYDILVSDPIEGVRRAELRKDGETLMSWSEANFQLLAPAEVVGLNLMTMRTWIDTLDPIKRKAAKLLQWGNMIANGRIMPLEQQSDATKMPPNCYTFQPSRAVIAKRVGVVRDFSEGADLGKRTAVPLEDYKPAF